MWVPQMLIPVGAALFSGEMLRQIVLRIRGGEPSSEREEPKHEEE
jgi:hypothetical protein